MFCHNCGMKLEDDAVFCVNCGMKVVSANMEDGDSDRTVFLGKELDEAGKGKAVPEEKGVQMTEPSGQETQEQGAAGQDGPGSQEQGAAGQGGPENASAAEVKIEAVEISPTGVVETGTAVVVPGGMEQRRFCPNCGTANDINDLFCRECGMFFGNASEKMAGGNDTVKPRRKRGAWKLAFAGAAVLAAAALGFVFVPRFLGGLTAGDQEADFIMYLKDNELTMARRNKYEPMVVGERVLDDAGEAPFGAGCVDGSGIVAYSPDRKYIYYPQKADDGEFDLYRRKLGNRKAEPEKIDSQVVEYKVIDNDRLIYVKDGKDRKLYLYKKGESEKIASDAWGIQISAGDKYILWRSDEKLYVQDLNLKSDKVKLESDITTIYGISDDFNTIVYEKDGNLYVLRGMEEREKIASDVYMYNAYVYDINGKLKIYYLKENGEDTISYYDLVEDDCLEQDRQMAEPRIEDYQRVTYKDTFWGMRESVEVNDSYYEEMEKYEQKLARDNLRTTLEYSTVGVQGWDVYYYDAAADESDKVMEMLMKSGEMLYGSVGTDTAAMMYVNNLDLEKAEKLKLSKLADANYNGIEEQITEKLGDCRQFLYLENGAVREIEDFEDENAGCYVQADEENHMMYISVFGAGHNKLYRFHYGQDNASIELVTDELWRTGSAKMGEISYINEDGDLYYGDDRIDEDVDDLTVWGDEAVFYVTDADKDVVEGTLHMYRHGKSVEIADDVAIGSYVMFDGGKVAFLTDYNVKKYRGDLNVYDGKNVKRIDSDVTAIFSDIP